MLQITNSKIKTFLTSFAVHCQDFNDKKKEIGLSPISKFIPQSVSPQKTFL